MLSDDQRAAIVTARLSSPEGQHPQQKGPTMTTTAEIDYITGNFMAELRLSVRGNIVNVRVTREINLDRDHSGNWLVMVHRTDPDVMHELERFGESAMASALSVADSTVCAFLDQFAAMLADPDGFGRDEQFTPPVITPAEDAA